MIETAVVGVGFTALVRKSERTVGDLVLQVAHSAIVGAGLEVQDIDGYAGTPIMFHQTAQRLDGVSQVSGGYIAAGLGLKNMRWLSDAARGVVSDVIINVVLALHAGLCSHVLVVRAMHNPTGVRYATTGRAYAGGPA